MSNIKDHLGADPIPLQCKGCEKGFDDGAKGCKKKFVMTALDDNNSDPINPKSSTKKED